MTTLLHIDSSPLFQGSVTRELSAAFRAEWTASHDGGTVLTRDLYTTALAPVDAEWVAAIHTAEELRTPRQKDLLVPSETLIAELERADEYVFGVPVHNFGVPAVLKLWIDQVTRPQRTFSYAGGTAKGLLLGKKATFIVASGGPRVDGYDFATPYLQSLFGFLGVTDVRFVGVHGTMALNYGQERAPFLAPHLQAARTLAQAA